MRASPVTGTSPHDLQADVDLIGGIEVVPTILDVVCRVTGMGFAAVARVTEERWIACSVRDDIAFGLNPGGELDVETTICHEIRQSRSPVVIDNVSEHPDYCRHHTPARYGFQSYVSMPIVLPDGTFFGTLCAIDPEPAPVDRPEVVNTIRMFADLIAFHVDAHRRTVTAQDAIRSEAFLRGILAASPDCVTVLSAEGRLEYMNARGIELNQIDPVQDVLGQEFATLWPEGEQARIRDAIRRAAEGEIVRTEGFHPTAKGEPRWWEASFAAFRPDGDAGLKLVGVSRDVTERTRAEVALRESELRYRTLFEAIDAGFCIVELQFDETGKAVDYRFLEVNPAFERHTGLKDAAGRWMRDLAPAHEQHWFDVYGQVALTGEPARVENPARFLRERWYDVHAFRIGDPAARRVAILFSDITERRRLEAQLRGLNEGLEKQVEARTRERDRIWQVSQDMLGVADASGIWHSVNPAWTAILGWRPEDIVGRTSEWLEHPADRERTRAEVARLAAGRTTLTFENRFRTRGDNYRTLSWRAVPVGGMLYCVARDVTEQRERGMLLEQAEEALRQSQKLEAVGQLTGGVAHDFNNLLTIIRSSVDFLRRPNLPEDRRTRYMDAVSDTVDRAAKLTGQLLAFARRQTLKPEVIDVGARLRAVADMLDTVTGARIDVVTELPDTPCFVMADLSQFETALVNMAVNARDAMDGEGTLTLRLVCSGSLPAIRGHAPAPGPFAAVSLTDTGSGIPPDQVGRIFEPFFTTKEVGKGTGLGLSQVFGFTKQSGGDVDVESTPGCGTTFTLYLPEIDAVPRDEPTPGRGDRTFPMGGGQRVLVVEDNIEVGHFATQILEDYGYRTTWAANAEEALEHLGLDGSGFDAVFTDVVMPGMGGIELAKRLRRQIPGLPVLLASGYSHVLAQEGAYGFELLHKPYSADQLGRILGRLLPGRMSD